MKDKMGIMVNAKDCMGSKVEGRFMCEIHRKDSQSEDRCFCSGEMVVTVIFGDMFGESASEIVKPNPMTIQFQSLG